MKDKEYWVVTAQKKYHCVDWNSLVEKTSVLESLDIPYTVFYVNSADELTELLVKVSEVLVCKK